MVNLRYLVIKWKIYYGSVYMNAAYGDNPVGDLSIKAFLTQYVFPLKWHTQYINLSRKHKTAKTKI